MTLAEALSYINEDGSEYVIYCDCVRCSVALFLVDLGVEPFEWHGPMVPAAIVLDQYRDWAADLGFKNLASGTMLGLLLRDWNYSKQRGARANSYFVTDLSAPKRLVYKHLDQHRRIAAQKHRDMLNPPAVKHCVGRVRRVKRTLRTFMLWLSEQQSNDLAVAISELYWQFDKEAAAGGAS